MNHSAVLSSENNTLNRVDISTNIEWEKERRSLPVSENL